MPGDADQLVVQIIEEEGPLTFVVTRDMLAGGEPGELELVVDVARRRGRLPQMVGRVVMLFPEYSRDDREIFEIPECRKFLAALQQKIPYLCVLLQPQVAFPLLMLCYVPWKKRGMLRKRVVAEQGAAMGFMLSSGMTAFEFARWQRLDAKRFTAAFLANLGAGRQVCPELLEDYARDYASHRAWRQRFS